MNNLLQSLRGVLSALIGFQSPENGLLEKARRRWNEGRTNRPSLLDEAWEERVMFARPAQPDGRSRCPGLAGAALPAPCVGECRHYPLCVDALLARGRSRTALAEYAQSALAGYEVFF